MRDLELKLKWRRTWLDVDSDFVAIDKRMANAGIVGRIYLFTEGPSKDKWFWSLTATGKGINRPVGADRGYLSSAREAAQCVEDAWFGAIGDLAKDAPHGSVGTTWPLD